jgi:uncharacterized protein (DUF427 family)
MRRHRRGRPLLRIHARAALGHPARRGNHYFPAASLREEHFRESGHHSVCPWKGTASYYDVLVGSAVNA